MTIVDGAYRISAGPAQLQLQPLYLHSLASALRTPPLERAWPRPARDGAFSPAPPVVEVAPTAGDDSMYI